MANYSCKSFLWRPKT